VGTFNHEPTLFGTNKEHSTKVKVQKITGGGRDKVEKLPQGSRSIDGSREGLHTLQPPYELVIRDVALVH
jgi:hypothetical protein